MIDHSESRAILVGASQYNDSTIPDVPAAANSLREFYTLLTDPKLCGWPAERVTLIENPSTASKLAQKIRRASAGTNSALLVYFVGHGMLTDSGELCFAVRETEANDPDLTGLEYRHVRRAILDSPAQSKILILDCCYSGKAIQALAVGKTDLADASSISGAYTLTAADNAAHVPPLVAQEEHLTSFTNVFINLVRKGLAGDQEFLSLSAIYPELLRRLRAAGLPEPNQRGTDTIQLYPFSRNAAFAADQQTNAVTHLALRVTRNRLYFDLAELGRQTVDLLQQQPRLPLTPEHTESIREECGIYQLCRSNESEEEVLYLGADSKSLLRRLVEHRRKITGRHSLSPETIQFRYLYYDSDPSPIIKSVLMVNPITPKWNNNGFGAHDGGRERDGSEVRKNSFDSLYPIDLDYIVEHVPVGPLPIALAIEELKRRIPYIFRWHLPAAGIDNVMIKLPRGPASVHEIFRRIAPTMGYSWQLTALNSHAILRQERRNYPAAIRYYYGTAVADVIPENEIDRYHELKYRGS